ncbi:phage tail protein [Salmonella enterica]|nr:phage tail protein [Salmonella enterica]ELP9178346.1 phage tail protein [Salmonella enterica]
MSQTTITLAFERWKAQQGATGEPVLLDEFVFASVPGLEPDRPVDRNETLPSAEQIVHRQAVSRKGVVNDNAVVHSVVLGADMGDFSFNWIGLINKASGTLAMIVHAPLQQKLKTAEGQQGNVLTRSFLMEYNGAQAETGINTPAETWQIDFTARMAGMDERQRLENIDIFGAAAFFGDGYLVGKSGNQFYVTKGTGYVAGLRTTLAENLNITVTTRPVKVWLDVCWTGTLTSVWGVQSRITVADSLADYVQNGVQHYVFAVAGIDENGNITDLRPKGTLNEQQASDALRKHEQSRNHPDATTREKGFVQLSSDTNSESESLAATPKAVKAAMDNANGRLEKNSNGSDIPDKAKFVENLGLGETINLAKNAVPATRRVNSKPLTGDITLWASDVGAISADAVGEITDSGTMASANTPGWWRVSVSNSDSVADFPTWPDGSKLYSYGYMFVEKIGEVWFQHYYAHMGANAKRQDWGTVPNTSRPWVIDYNTANKPSAGDVGALPIAGGRLNGPLSIGTDNALGGNSIVLGDNDTGIKQNGDGVLDIYANSAHVLRFISSLVESMASLKVNGNAVATGEVQAGNGSSRMTNNGDIFGSVWGNSWLSIWINNNFVADVQLGAGTSVSTWDKAGSWPNTPGYVVTSVWKDANGINIDGIDYAPLQKRFGNQWYTVQGGTA